MDQVLVDASQKEMSISGIVNLFGVDYFKQQSITLNTSDNLIKKATISETMIKQFGLIFCLTNVVKSNLRMENSEDDHDINLLIPHTALVILQDSVSVNLISISPAVKNVHFVSALISCSKR